MELLTALLNVLSPLPDLDLIQEELKNVLFIFRLVCKYNSRVMKNVKPNLYASRIHQDMTRLNFLCASGNLNAGCISDCISGCLSVSNLEGNEYNQSGQFCISGSCPNTKASRFCSTPTDIDFFTSDTSPKLPNNIEYSRIYPRMVTDIRIFKCNNALKLPCKPSIPQYHQSRSQK